MTKSITELTDLWNYSLKTFQESDDIREIRIAGYSLIEIMEFQFMEANKTSNYISVISGLRETTINDVIKRIEVLEAHRDL